MFSFGSDPEFCLINNEKKLISAIELVPGNKKNKYELKGNYFYNDNVLAECNVKPGYSKEETIENFREIIQDYHQIIGDNKLFCIASVEYPEDQLVHPEAKEIGCDPETCCYDLCDHHPDRDLFQKTNVRTSGGHIHVGHQMLSVPSAINRYRFIRMMDLFVGIPSVFLDQDPTSSNRRSIYGEPGRFRKQKHGAEYRSLSNFWLVHPDLTGIIYDLTEIAVNMVEARRWSTMVMFHRTFACKRTVWVSSPSEQALARLYRSACNQRYGLQQCSSPTERVKYMILTEPLRRGGYLRFFKTGC